MPVYLSRKAIPLAAAVLLSAGSVAGSGATPSATAPATDPPAEQVYKNIQVLKGTPAGQLIPAMQFITASLGVHCEHCHVEGAFDKDDKKPKQQARQMIKMMEALNQENFSGRREVTCYSCHRGALRPVETPRVQGEAESASNPVAAEAPPSRLGDEIGSADETLNHYLQAIGGAAALQSIRSQTEKGTLDAGSGAQFPVEVALQSPDKRSMVIHFSGGNSLEVLNGDFGWSLVPGRSLHEMNHAEVEAAHLQADPGLWARIKRSYSEFKKVREIPIAGRPAVEIRASAANLPPLQLCFDRDSGLLLRIVRFVDSPLGRNPTQIDYSDYRNVAGTMQPFRWTVSQPQARYTVQLSAIEVNQPLEDSLFSKPESSPPAQAH
jgi:hypothetical protein